MFYVEQRGADGHWRQATEWFTARWAAINARNFRFARSSDTRVVERKRADRLATGDRLPIGGPEAARILGVDHDEVVNIEEDGPARVIVHCRGPLGDRICKRDDMFTVDLTTCEAA